MRFHGRFVHSYLALVVLALSLISAQAQNFRGAIGGSVVDASGSAIPNAQVAATANGTGQVYSTQPSAAGEFFFQDLPLGAYTITASAIGFETLKVNNVQVSAGAIYTLPIKLRVASQAVTVEVNAAGVTLDTATTTQTTVIPTKTVQDTPMNGRDFTQLLALTPGFAGYSASGGAGIASVNGTRSNSVNW
ncbi:MAG: hypothetical protein QOE55_6261, partial [Acidobacteriaceae bacterium]|nr:hypothetical protein [Acidobacteriaceae bacterium]